MSSLSEDLAKLHRLLLELEEVEEMQSSGPRKIAAQERLANKQREKCDAFKQSIMDLRKATDEKQLQLKTNEARIADLGAKLNAASSNREYGIIKSQIEADTMANSVLEDEILESMEKIDAANVELNEMEAEYTTAVERQKKTAAEVAASAAGLAQKAEELGGKIKESEKVVPAKIGDTYRRLRGAHGAGALAGVDKLACLSCYSEISRQESVKVNTGHIVMCKNCGRLLYRSTEES